MASQVNPVRIIVEVGTRFAGFSLVPTLTLRWLDPVDGLWRFRRVDTLTGERNIVEQILENMLGFYPDTDVSVKGKEILLGVDPFNFPEA